MRVRGAGVLWRPCQKGASTGTSCCQCRLFTCMHRVMLCQCFLPLLFTASLLASSDATCSMSALSEHTVGL